PSSAQESCCAEEQSARADRKDTARAACLPIDPGENLRVLHHGFLAEPAGYMKHIEPGCIAKRRIWRQPKPPDVTHGCGRLGVNAIGRVGNARQDLEGAGQIDLVEVIEKQGSDLQMRLVRDHGVLSIQLDSGNLTGHALAQMPKAPRFSPSSISRAT